MMGADDVRPTSREELKALPKKERKRLLLAAVTKVEEKIAWLEEQLVETSAERDELKDNEVPRLVQESQQCREDLRQLQETHDATLTTHATELQWWKSEVEKKALIISQQVEEIERARDELEEMKGQKDKDAASALKQSEVLARCQEDLEKCQQEAEKRKEEFSKQAEEMQITQAANAQINEDAMRLQKELDQCRAEAEEFQALRAETERLRAADVAATLLLSEKEEELQYLAEELGESRHHVARLEYQMKWMVEEAEEAEEDATPTTEVWGFAFARWADSSDSEADSDLELDPGASAMTVDGFCDRPEASSLFEVHWANIPVEAVAFEAKGHAPDAKAAAELDELAEDELDRAQVFKTAMCKFWRRGTCIYGENCNFVHGEEEKQPLYKAKLCKYFQRGHCTRGANCTFAHGVEELQDGTAPTPLAADFGVSPYKRKICKFWMRGACWAGESCTYAHGAEELQHPEVGRAAWAPRTPENSAWNINYETRYEPEMYFGRWENHSYFPSPSDWRSFSIYQPITDGCLYTFCFTSQRE